MPLYIFAVYQEFVSDMIEVMEVQNVYYVPLMVIGFIVMASVLMYRQKEQQICINLKNEKYRKEDPETRYDEDGTRYQCVSVPFRVINNEKVEIFMITSRNRGDYIFPGGGWEKHENGAGAAQREAFEEAGVRGKIIKEMVSDQRYTSEKGNKSRLWGYLLEINQVLEEWPETERRRKWMTIDEVEIALSPRRRAKFGALWRKSVQYFIEQNLYNPTNTNSLKIK